MVSFFKFPTRGILVIGVFFTATFHSYAQENAVQILEAARKLRDQQAIGEAYETLLLLRTNQQTTESLQLRSSLEVELGNADDAILSLTALIALDNNYLEAYFQRGKLYLDLNLLNEADLDFTYIIDNQHQDTRSILFQISESGNEQVKIQTLQQMIPEVYVYRARAREKVGQLSKAEYDYDKAIEMDSCTDRLIDRALYYSRQNQREKSIIDLNSAINLDFNNAKAWYNLLILEPRTVIPAHIDYEEYKPLLKYKVVEAIVKSDPLQAEKLLNNLIVMVPDDDEMLILQGRVAYLKKDYKRAEQYFLAAVSEIPHRTEIYFLLGNLYFQTKEYQKSIDAYSMYLIFEPQDGKTMYNLANAFFAMKNIEGGCNYLSRAIFAGFEVNVNLKKKCINLNEGF